MEIKGFMIVSKKCGKDCFYTGSKMGAGFGGIYGAKIYKSEKTAQNTIDSHSGIYWKDARIVPATLNIEL